MLIIATSYLAFVTLFLTFVLTFGSPKSHRLLTVQATVH